MVYDGGKICTELLNSMCTAFVLLHVQSKDLIASIQLYNYLKNFHETSSKMLCSFWLSKGTTDFFSFYMKVMFV